MLDMVIFCNSSQVKWRCLYFLDDMMLTKGTPVTFGSGESGEEFLAANQPPGDIVPGVLRAVPPASSGFAEMPVGGNVFTRIQEVDGPEISLPATHWGKGIVLLDRDRDLCRDALRNVLLNTGSRWVQNQGYVALHNHLLRSFFFGRSYARLYALGSYRGYRTVHVPFLHNRLEAIQRKFFFDTCHLNHK